MSIENTSQNSPEWRSAQIEPEFKTAREFSKEHLASRRQEQADKIREKRKTYFIDKKRKQEAAVEQLPEREEERLRILEEIKITQASLDRSAKKLRLNIFEKIVGSRKKLASSRSRVREVITNTEENLSGTLKKLEEIESQIHWLDATAQGIVRTSDFSKLRDDAQGDIKFDNEFYVREHTAYEEGREKQLRHKLRLLEEEPDRTIEHFATEEGVVFVHGTHPSFDPTENSAIVDGLSWDQKARLAIGLEPTLSTSSVRQGCENFENIFAGVGLIIGKGKIEYADTSDADTVPTSLTEFEIRKPFVGGTREVTERDIPTLEYISSVLEKGPRQRQQMKHNEIVVSRPKAVGVYFVADNIADETLKAAYTVPDCSEIEAFSAEMDLPVFGFKDGHFYPALFDTDTNTYALDESHPLSSDQFEDLPVVAEEKRDAIIKNAKSRQDALFKVPID